MNWIKTSERLPDIDQTILFIVIEHILDNAQTVDEEMGTFYENGFHGWCSGFRYEIKLVPYWMPLPELPEELR